MQSCRSEAIVFEFEPTIFLYLLVELFKVGSLRFVVLEHQFECLGESVDAGVLVLHLLDKLQ